MWRTFKKSRWCHLYNDLLLSEEVWIWYTKGHMIHQDIKSGIPTAMKARDAVRLTTLRAVATACMNELVATKRKPDEMLADEEVLAVIRREVKKRKEAATAFRTGAREELAANEEAERVVLETFLPTQMSEEEVRAVAEAKKTELGVTDKKDMGRFMGAVMKELAGKADGAVVKKVIDSLF